MYADKVPQRERSQNIVIALLDHNAEDLLQHFHPPFYGVYTNVQDARPLRAHPEVPIIDNRMGDLDHRVPYPLNAVDYEGESEAGQDRIGFVASERGETIEGSSVGSEWQRKPDVLLQEKIQNCIGMGPG